jgi:hypothetical protein
VLLQLGFVLMAKLWDTSSQYGFIEAIINILSTVTEGFQIQVRQLTGTANRNFPCGVCDVPDWLSRAFSGSVVHSH